MKKQTWRSRALLMAVLVLVGGLLIASMAATTSRIRTPQRKIAFGQSEILPWNNLSAAAILKEIGSTANGERSLADVYRRQGKEFFTLDAGKTQYTFFNASEINYISTTDPDFIGPRQTHVGMAESALFALYPCTNRTLIARLRDSKTPLFTADMFVDAEEGEELTAMIYDLGEPDRAPRYFAAVHPDPDGDPDHYRVHFTHTISIGRSPRSPKRVYCHVAYEIANHAVIQMNVCIADVA